MEVRERQLQSEGARVRLRHRLLVALVLLLAVAHPATEERVGRAVHVQGR